MKLSVIGSGSKGNSYILDNGIESLVIECGMPFDLIEKALDYNVSRIRGVLLTHEHIDHAKYAKKFIDRQIPIYASKGTFEALELSGTSSMVRAMAENEICRIGGFTFQSFKTQHNAKEPFGFLIYHNEMGLTLFATDTSYIHATFDSLNNILIECNHDVRILTDNYNKGLVHPKVYKHIISGHCNYDLCLEMLMNMDLSGVNNIVLIHLSESNSDADKFIKGITEATGKTVYIAKPKLTIDNFNISPF